MTTMVMESGPSGEVCLVQLPRNSASSPKVLDPRSKYFAVLYLDERHYPGNQRDGADRERERESAREREREKEREREREREKGGGTCNLVATSPGSSVFAANFECMLINQQGFCNLLQLEQRERSCPKNFSKETSLRTFHVK